jgi:hypothetical protein
MTSAAAQLLAQLEAQHQHLVQYQGRNYAGTLIWYEGQTCPECPDPAEPVVRELIRAGVVVEARRWSNGTLETVAWYPENAFDRAYGPWLLTQVAEPLDTEPGSMQITKSVL